MKAIMLPIEHLSKGAVNLLPATRLSDPVPGSGPELRN